MGTVGPIINVRYTPLSIRRPRYSFGQRYSKPAAQFFGLLLGPHPPLRITNSPELERVAKVSRGDVIDSLSLHHRVLLQRGEALRLRHKSTPEVGVSSAVTGLDCRSLNCEVAARRWKRHH